jgi:hypothetical protein
VETSQSIKELATALCKAQAAMKEAKKDAENPGFKRDGKASKYADLESVWEACKDALTKNGLSVVQGGTIIDGHACLETILLHSSGEFIKSTFRLNATKNDPQGIGSAITYYRRYSLASMVGVVQADDDGNAASVRTEASPQKQESKEKSSDKISSAQLTRMHTIAGAAGWTKEQASHLLSKRFGFASSKDVTKFAYENICKILETKKFSDVFPDGIK